MVPRDLNVRLCEALGLDPTTTSAITIKVLPYEPTVVEVKQLVTDKNDGKLVAELKRYTLTPT